MKNPSLGDKNGKNVPRQRIMIAGTDDVDDRARARPDKKDHAPASQRTLAPPQPATCGQPAGNLRRTEAAGAQRAALVRMTRDAKNDGESPEASNVECRFRVVPVVDGGEPWGEPKRHSPLEEDGDGVLGCFFERGLPSGLAEYRTRIPRTLSEK